MTSLMLALTTAAALVSAPAGEGQENETIRVLLVTGVDYPAHHWKETAPVVRRALERDKRFEVRIIEDPSFLASDVMFGYDVVFLHFRTYKPNDRGYEKGMLQIVQEEKVQANLSKFVNEGGGLALVHYACAAFLHWPEFSSLAGKVFTPQTDYQGRNHDPCRKFDVNIVNKEHPITRGMKDFQAHDELWFCVKGDRPVDVLATSRSTITGKDHPMVFVFSYGKGRVFHTPLGHDVKAFEVPGVGEFLRRGCAWAAGQKP